MRAQGWDVIDVMDGNYDVESIVAALRLASNSPKPTFVNIRTVIGIGTATAGTYKAHHGGIDAESLVRFKIQAGLDPQSSHQILPNSLAFLRERRAHGQRIQAEWNTELKHYCELYPQDGENLQARSRSTTGEGIKLLQTFDSKRLSGKATRQSNGVVLEELWAAVPSLCGGGADLVNSNQIKYAETDVFLPSEGYRGRYIRNGIREHAMASIANGMAAYSPGTFLPITATFMLFFLYVSTKLVQNFKMSV